MNITRVLQPNVCCIGNPVAGNPTQFVMVRASRSAGLDWRFFTSQVAVDQFQIALRGIQALGLDGVAFFEPFQTLALPLLDTVTEAALAMSSVTVARSDNGSWLGDNTLGAAIARCVESRQPSNDVPNSKLGSIVVLDAPQVARVIELAMPTQRERVVQWSTTERELPSVAEEPAKSSDSEASTNEDVESCASNELPMDFLVLSKIPSPLVVRQISTMQWSSKSACLVLEPHSEKLLRPLRQLLDKHRTEWVESVELMTNQAVTDFHFWTGVTPPVDLIRESLEEYLQW
jgi:shikimate dehydrogenase